MAGTRRNRRRTAIGGQFAPRLIEMISSPAFRVLSLSVRRALARIELELASHGGTDNGRLPTTFDDFMKFGIDRHAIAPALRELVALGLVEVTERGRAGNAEFRSPNKFGLTYRHTDHGSPTHEWRRATSVEQAEATARGARKTPEARKRKPVGESAENRWGETTPKTGIPDGVNPHY